MSGLKLDLIWSPHYQNRFITVGNDLQLYEIEEIRDGFSNSSALQISDSSVANLLAVSSDFTYLKCVSWYPKPRHDQLLAVGLSNGKVILHNLGDAADELTDFSAKEFLPKHSRPCNCLSWNPDDPKLLACGMEKNRVDYGLLIWDVTRSKSNSSDGLSSMENIRSHINMFTVDNSNTSKPVLELGISESAQSLHWFYPSNHLIVCGMNNKHLKIYDTRDAVKAQNSTPTKAVYGVCVDPYFEHRLSSFVENLFVLWDVRNFEKPLVTTHKQKQILKISWCPTRPSVLAALTKDSKAIKLYNIQSSMGNDEVEPTIVERNVLPTENSFVNSFAWHPSQENRLIISSPNNNIIDYTVYDRITLNWSPRSEVVWAYDKKILHFIGSNEEFCKSLDDISVIMRTRAINGYGMVMSQSWSNGTLASDSGLLGVWVWIDHVKEHRQDKKCKGKGSLKYEGVYTIICGENGLNTLSSSEPIQASWVGLNFSSCKVVKFVSEERERALRLCSWGSEADPIILTSFLERLEQDNQFLRAASIAVFSLDIRRAIQILNRGAVSNNPGPIDLNAIAMALAGYTEERTALWREISSNLKSQFKDPYLRAMFTFLTDESNNYDEILNESDIAVQDRLTIALLYLPDRKLAEFLDKLKANMMEIGMLDGMLLTGLTMDGLTLMQKYVDRTGDVQTVSLILLHTLPSTLSHHPRALAWVDAYRELLDVWRLWKQRASFDVHWYKMVPADKPQQQVFVTCTYCGKSLSSYIQHAVVPYNNSRFSQVPAGPANKAKMTCCPNCRKPLPRCSLCLSRMGTLSGLHWKRPIEGKPGKKLTEFSSWLTWCQTCRHGGHSVHILGWFEEHTECPVTGCTCKCMSLDAVAKLGFASKDEPQSIITT